MLDKKWKESRKKGFTLVELIVVMAVLAVLVLLAAPKFLGHTKETQFAKHINNAKVMADASERYYIDHGTWPRGGDEEVYTPEEVSAYADKVFDITGEEIALTDGKYWDIDYAALAAYAKLPDADERANYVLRNPVGTVYYLEELTEAGETRLPAENNETSANDITLAPGPKTLVGGDMQAGYFGWVSANDLVTGDGLAAIVGVTQGVSQFSNEGWLKFAYQGKIQFVAKKTIRYSTSWDHLNAHGVVFGEKIVDINGLTYKVRLMRGASMATNDTDNGTINHESEWNQLMLPIHLHASDKAWYSVGNVEDYLPDWGIGFTDKDLHTSNTYGPGSWSWTQDFNATLSYRIGRGYNDISRSFSSRSSNIHSYEGWRPVLELVQ